MRHYSSADLRPLLLHESAVWAQCMAWDYHSSAEMILRYVDSRILPGYVAVENGRIVGYTFFVYESTKGVIGDLFVAETGGSESTATRNKLLAHAIETLQQTPGLHRVEAQLLVHDAGVIAGPFLKEGFQVYARLFMVLPLDGLQSGSSARKLDDVQIRRWSESDFQASAALITACYVGHVDSQINDQYRTIAGSLRFLNNIVRFPGCGIFDSSSSFVAINTTGEFVGLLLCSRVRDDVGHVTQVCVLPQQKGRGLGEALIEACAADLRRRRFTELSLTVTEGNRRAVDLYKRLGFQTRRVFDAFIWEG